MKNVRCLSADFKWDIIMIDSNGNKIAEKTSVKDYDFNIAEMKFLMKGFRNCQDVKRAVTVTNALKTILDNQDIFKLIESEDVTCIEDFIKELEDYSDFAGNANLLWEMVYLRRRLANAYNSIDMKHYAVDSRFTGALHFDRICTLLPTAFNYGARYCEYANTVRFVQREPEVHDKWDTEKVKKLFLRAENFVESENMLKNNDYLDGAAYYYEAKQKYYSVISDKLSEYHASKREVYYLREQYRMGESVDVLRELVNKYIHYTGFERYSYPDEKQHFETLLEWVKAWNEKEDSMKSGVTYRRLLNCYRNFIQ